MIMTNNSNKNNDLNNSQNNKNFEEELSIIFEKSFKDSANENRLEGVICKYNDLVKDVIDKYLLKTNQKKENLLFIFNAHNINESFRTVLEQGICNGYVIRVDRAHSITSGDF